MARSTYIYILTATKPKIALVGAYTVKHEMVWEIENRFPIGTFRVQRVRDGEGSGDGIDITNQIVEEMGT